MTEIPLPRRRLMGVVLLLAGLLPTAGVLLLPAIGWPDSVQGMSAAEALPRVRANEVAFRLGYLAMVAGGILFLPAALHLIRRLEVAGSAGRSLAVPLELLFGLALVSTSLRVLWYGASLTVVPVLDSIFGAGDTASRAAVEVVYVAGNDLLSTVQEDLGVNIFGGLFILLASVAMARKQVCPAWIAVLGVVSGVSYLISSSELLGLDNGNIIPVLGPALSSVWLIALAVVELRSRNAVRVPL